MPHYVICVYELVPENVARGKTASQHADLFWNNFTWTADKAVDGCVTQADPDSSGCCSCNAGSGHNSYWKVNLGEKYSVINVTVIGRELGTGRKFHFIVLYYSYQY